MSSLTVDQWNLISILCHCYDEYSGLPTAEQFMREQNLLPLKSRFKSASLISLIKTLLDGAQLLYKSNQDFLSLSGDDRSVLLYSTMKHTASFLSDIVYQKVRLLGHPAFYNVIQLITNPNVLPSAMRIAELLDFDMVIEKIVLGILAFSTTSYTTYSDSPATNLSDLRKVLNIQDKYIELAWRYLLYKYDEKQAVICFSKLIRCLFAVNESIVRACDTEWVTSKMVDIIQQTEQALIISC